MKDYRVRMEVHFDLDVPANGKDDAKQVAADIVRIVFKQSFSRAQALSIPWMQQLAEEL